MAVYERVQIEIQFLTEKCFKQDLMKMVAEAEWSLLSVIAVVINVD